VDVELEYRWREGLPPFDGLIALSPVFPEEELRSHLQLVVGLLPQTRSVTTVEDWHQHDGYLAPSVVEPYDLLVAATQDTASLGRWSSDDTHVRRAWYADDYSFLLRWCRSTDPDDFGAPPGGPAGLFDVSGSSQLIEHVVALVPGCRTLSAKDYFDGAWAG
jgi:hypothetical protein